MDRHRVTLKEIAQAANVSIGTVDRALNNRPGVNVEEARLSLFCTSNYRTLAQQITDACIDAGLTVTARTYVGHEDDTGYHHWAIDLASFETTSHQQ